MPDATIPAPTSPARNLDLLVGGQAVLEGILMRGRLGWAVAVRRKDGTIATDHGRISNWGTRFPILRLPLLRGSVVLIQSLLLGIRALSFAAEHAEIEEKDGTAAEPLTRAQAVGTLAAAIGFAVLLFVLFPLGVSVAVEKWLWPDMPNLAFNALDGLVRVLAFVGYLVAISRIPEIGRVFQYHGAEHKVVWTYEERGELSVESASRRSRLHPRCGTSFLFFVIVVSIVVFAFVPKAAPLVVKAAARVVLMPLIAGIAYETIRWSGKRPESPIVKPLIAPGLWLQNVTTREPSPDQVEIALLALALALRYDGEVIEPPVPHEAFGVPLTMTA